MAVYRQIQVTFWQDPFILDLTPEEKYFYIYLMTNSKTTQCGVYELPKKVIELETGYNRDTVEKLIKRFVDYGKIQYNSENKEVMILNWLKYNITKSPKVISCIRQEALEIKTAEFKEMVDKKLMAMGYTEDIGLYRMANKSEISKTAALKIFERDQYKCTRCGSTEDLTIDHIFPRNIGGTNAETNLRVLCRSCNSKRPTSGNELIEDLAKDGYFMEQFDTVCNINDTVSNKNDSVSKMWGEEKEKEKEEEKEEIKNDDDVIVLFPDESEFIEILSGVDNYPLDRKKDREYYQKLKARYPTLDIIEALREWCIYKQDHPLKKGDSPRSQINTSFKKYVEWGKCLKQQNKSPTSSNFKAFDFTGIGG